eukprot:TRINITY_DN65988_c0_g1_i1.p1 TRINITY_DN65988_c0_g1~~TRINITY_DN65988_c0_g1_i1.p1  ORF type:complete len:250 (+),score=101.34 TRINITY_DN65988_c0_g1_i1:45-752(+)
MAQRVVVYGGSGALGRVVVDKFVSQNWSTISVDLVPNAKASQQVLVDPKFSWTEASEHVLQSLEKELGSGKVDAVVNVAGGWAGGNIAANDIVQSSELMWKQSVQSSIISGQIASRHMRESGLVVLTGAAPAKDGTSFMIGYGMAKAAVHQLVKSLAQEDSGLPAGTSTVAILPNTIDTPGNRAGMPDADFSSWTPCETFADAIYGWTSQPPANGSLQQFNTKEGKTDIVNVTSA